RIIASRALRAAGCAASILPRGRRVCVTFGVARDPSTLKCASRGWLRLCRHREVPLDIAFARWKIEVPPLVRVGLEPGPHHRGREELAVCPLVRRDLRRSQLAAGIETVEPGAHVDVVSLARAAGVAIRRRMD